MPGFISDQIYLISSRPAPTARLWVDRWHDCRCHFWHISSSVPRSFWYHVSWFASRGLLWTFDAHYMCIVQSPIETTDHRLVRCRCCLVGYGSWSGHNVLRLASTHSTSARHGTCRRQTGHGRFWRPLCVVWCSWTILHVRICLNAVFKSCHFCHINCSKYRSSPKNTVSGGTTEFQLRRVVTRASMRLTNA